MTDLDSKVLVELQKISSNVSSIAGSLGQIANCFTGYGPLHQIGISITALKDVIDKLADPTVTSETLKALQGSLGASHAENIELRAKLKHYEKDNYLNDSK